MYAHDFKQINLTLTLALTLVCRLNWLEAILKLIIWVQLKSAELVVKFTRTCLVTVFPVSEDRSTRTRL
jgi:hypothetical protein